MTEQPSKPARTVIPIRPARPPLLDLVQQALQDQQSLTAVERFARRHAQNGIPEQAKYYRDLIPLSDPGPEEQYAFEVDLDACTGCKSCVSACHSQNGLDPQEAWRSVGLLHGGTGTDPFQKTVTTACHHCLEPACLKGCPTNAYHKDPQTGIVSHLDDQCIGCKYCTLTCPYEVPQYNARLGIVRKCNMCQPRLKVGEAPACVQACPNQAIRIKIMPARQAIESAESGAFLPGAPSPAKTYPTTDYKTRAAFPHNLLPADYYSIRPSHSHLPLVFMLVLTQLSTGTFAAQWLLRRFWVDEMIGWLAPSLAVLSFLLGQVALAASLFHLGRPLYAFRAVVGLRRSWLSREIVAFGAFSGLASLYALSFWLKSLEPARGALETAVAAAGLLGVGTSVMVYRATRREFWDNGATAAKFYLTSAILGSSLLLALCMAFGLLSGAGDPGRMQWVRETGRLLAMLAACGIGLKLVLEISFLGHLRDYRLNPLKRSALLLTGALKGALKLRLAFGISGGILLLLPFLVAAENASLGFLFSCSVLSLLALAAGELLERYLFFTAEASDKMPGTLP